MERDRAETEGQSMLEHGMNAAKIFVSGGRRSVRQRTLFLVGGLSLLLASCATNSEQQFGPGPECATCQRAPDDPAGADGDEAYDGDGGVY